MFTYHLALAVGIHEVCTLLVHMWEQKKGGKKVGKIALMHLSHG